MKTFGDQSWAACDRCVQRKRPCWWTETEIETLMLVNIWIVHLDKSLDSETTDIGSWYMQCVDSAELRTQAIAYMEDTVAQEYRIAFGFFGGHDGAVKVVRTKILSHLDEGEFIRWATKMEETAGLPGQAGQVAYQPLMQDTSQSASNFPAGGEILTGAVDHSSGSMGAAPQAADDAWVPVDNPWSLDSKTVERLVKDPVRIRWYLRRNLGKRSHNKIASECDRCFLGQVDCELGPSARWQCVRYFAEAKKPNQKLSAPQLCIRTAMTAAEKTRKDEPHVGELEHMERQYERVKERNSVEGDSKKIRKNNKQLKELEDKIAALRGDRR
ncbi:hypothetical protein PG993_003742 [Apiospora rasikravindrae]|uniref:Uncharacterized protein n=1 Tax=Apiospora rasikravindrae TaxID=990691 RepID=A0ABR1U0X7_9PEZI